LLKVKQVQEAEAMVIGHEEGKGTHKGRLGSLRVKLPHGIVCSVGTGLSDAERENPPALGSVITFQYQELSEAGVPRFPSFLRVRSDGEIQRVDPGKELVSSPQKPTKSSPLTPSSKTGSTPKTERYFEYKDNKSSKFWEICVLGSDVTVRFGKIGGTGQTQSKSFNDPALAYAHAEKLIMAKAKKGYHEMSDENLSAGKERPNRKSGAFEPQMAPAQEHEPARVSEPGKNKSH
jgi:DNA ligase-1